MTITIVTGLGRCGTSLTMQALEAGGFPVVGEGPAFEPDETLPGRLGPSNPHAPAFVAECEGRALKLIDPVGAMNWPLPGGHDYRYVLLSRNVREQELSMRRFTRDLLGVDLDFGRAARRKMQAVIRRDQRALEKAVSRTGAPVLGVSFESLVSDTAFALSRIADFLGFALSIEAAAAVVVPRSVKARNDRLGLERALISNVRPRP